LDSWPQVAAAHMVPFKYNLLRESGRLVPSEVLSARGPWIALAGHRSLCRLRSAALDLAHVGGRRSVAKVRICILCAKQIRSAYLHVLGGDCQESQSELLPSAWTALNQRERAMRFLSCAPADDAFPVVCQIAKTIDVRCERFWSKQ